MNAGKLVAGKGFVAALLEASMISPEWMASWWEDAICRGTLSGIESAWLTSGVEGGWGKADIGAFRQRRSVFGVIFVDWGQLRCGACVGGCLARRFLSNGGDAEKTEDLLTGGAFLLSRLGGFTHGNKGGQICFDVIRTKLGS